MNRGWLAILALTAVVGAGAGAGAAGIVAQRGATPSPVAVAAAGGAGAAPGAAAGAAARPGGRGNGATAGTVDKVDGTTLTVRTQSGTIDVPLNEQTSLMRQTTVAASDLKVGDNVFGRGEDVDGKLVVRQLQIVPAGSRGAALAGLGGGAGFGGSPAGQTDEGAAGAGRGGQGGRNGQGVFGTLAKLDGRTITVTRPNGGDMTATLADDATIQRVAPATRDDLKAGQSIVVASPPSADGQPRAVITITSA
ncbi:MAG TPA: hypothetical protein VGL23_09660 [Chloroflexota bacterium]